MPVTTAVHEIQHHVRIHLTDAPRLTDMCGRTRTPVGLRVDYGLRRDITRVDITIEWADGTAQLWPPVAEMPAWLRQVIDAHRPRDVDVPDADRPTGMGGWPVYMTA